MRACCRNQLLPCLAALLLIGCGRSDPAEPAAGSPVEPPAVSSPAAAPSPQQAGDSQQRTAMDTEAARRLRLDQTYTGDYDELVRRRVIRALVVPSRTNYFLDGAQQRGIVYEAFSMFEKWINQELGNEELKVHVVIIPVAREHLFAMLMEGRGDVAAAGLTVTEDRLQLVDFSEPFMRDVSEVVVTGPSGPPIAGVEDLAGKEVYVRTSSSYHASLVALNERFRSEGRHEVVLRPAEPFLEDEDLLQMVDAGLVDMVTVDRHKAEFWGQIFENITVHPQVAVRTGGTIAWAFRKDSPQLKAVIDRFAQRHRAGTLMGNVVLNRYLKDTSIIRRAFSAEDQERYADTIAIFSKYAPQYGFETLMLAAQGYQESRLDQSLRSRRGAIGIMQLLPSTAADKAVQIPDIETADSNVHAGARYMAWIRDTYFDDPQVDPFNRALFAFASYNAGPNRIARLRAEAAERGLDPNIWFRNVEILVAEDIGRETVDYVSNIYKYYAAYRLLAENAERSR